MSQSNKQMVKEMFDDMYKVEPTFVKTSGKLHGEAYNQIMDIVRGNESDNNGGSTDYYKLPSNAKDLQDLIEHKNMNFAQGNIFKAMYRANDDTHSSYERELNKIIWFAQREINRIKHEVNDI